jgi:hypothetical protein
MPELPDIVIYIEALEKRILNQPLKRVRIMRLVKLCRNGSKECDMKLASVSRRE